MSSELSGIVSAGSKLPDHAASPPAVSLSVCVPYASASFPVANASQLIGSGFRKAECVLTFEATHSCELTNVFQTVHHEAVFVVQLLEDYLYLVK